MKKRLFLGGLIVAICFSLLGVEPNPVFTAEENLVAAGSAGSDDPKKGEEEKKKEDENHKKPLREVVPDTTAIPGLIPMHRKKENLYAEIGSGQLNTDYIIVISIAKGIGSSGLYTGQTWDFGDNMLWQFRKVDDRIQIVRRNFRHTADSGTTEEKAVKLGFADSILFSLPILAAGPGGGDVIDLTNIFLSDLPGISRYALPGYSFARDRSTWAKIKGKNDNLTDNMEIEVAATYAGGGGIDTSHPVMDSRGISVNVHYSISKLPASGYTPRLADERVGYFNTAVKNFNKNPDDGNFVRYINRWNLQKLESQADVSLPKKPIVFWLEKTIPYQYRKPIRDGILEWNKAFEEAGYYNAIEVRQQEDNDTWDPEDINYNTIRWSTTNMGFAIGPSRVNPLTGEILDADVVLDVGFINSWGRTLELYSPNELAMEFGGRALMAERFENPAKPNGSDTTVQPVGFDFEELAGRIPLTNESLYRSQQMGLAATFFDVMTAFADAGIPVGCEEGADESHADEPKKEDDSSDDKKDEKKICPKCGGLLVASAKERPKGAENSPESKPEEKTDDAEKSDGAEKKEEPKVCTCKPEKKDYEAARKKLIQQGLSHLATHEVGHTLGLRHNFKLSSLHTLEEINNWDAARKEGFGGSIMEYIPVNLMPEGEKQGDYNPTKLGLYDYWVIKYGYQVLSGGTDGEKKELEKIAAEQTKPENNYAEDFDCYFNSDPLINTFDLGSDPLEYSKLQVRRFKQILPGLNDRIVKEGESYAKLRSRFFTIFSDYGRAMFGASRYIGGIHLHRDFKGDPDARPPFVVVAAEQQRKAMEFLTSEVFGVDPYRFDPKLSNYLAPNRWYHWGSRIPTRYDSDLHDLMLVWQQSVLSELFDSDKISRMADTELRVAPGEDVFTLVEMFYSLSNAIFVELNSFEGEYSPQKPAVSSMRRNLQREYFKQIAAMALQKPYGWYNSQFSQSSFFDNMNGNVVMRPNNDVTSLARMQLHSLKDKIDRVLAKDAAFDSTMRIDVATKAHLTDLSIRAENALKASVERSF